MSLQIRTHPDIPTVGGERRSLLKLLSLGLAAAACTKGYASAAEAPHAIVAFVLYRKAGLSHEQSITEWNGERHIAIVKQVPGLRRWVQNHVTSAPNDSAPDGIGELWFDGVKELEQAMGSPQMGAAVEDAKRFLDMERSYALVVDAKDIIA